jgi:hypothetical protein
MKKIAIALLASLSAIAGAASAQTSANGITMTRDANVAAQIEQHARTVQAQPAASFDEDVQAPASKTVQKAKHHGKKTVAKAKKKALSTVASK